METAVTRTTIRGRALLNAQVILDARDVTENHPPKQETVLKTGDVFSLLPLEFFFRVMTVNYLNNQVGRAV